MTSPATPTTRNCERCESAPVQSVKALGETFHGKYCSPCAEILLAKDEQRERAAMSQYLLDRSGRTPRLDRFTWERATRAEAARKWLAGYYDGSRSNLILFGAVGAGKSALAWLAVRDLCEHGVPAWMVTFRNLLADMRAAMSTGDPAPWATRAATIPVLALDDIGAERPTAWALDELATIVDKRYERELPTIVTTNYKLDDLARRLGQEDLLVGRRIVSRLAEKSDQYVFSGVDRRVAA